MTVLVYITVVLVAAGFAAFGLTLSDHRRKLRNLKNRAAAPAEPAAPAVAPTNPVRTATKRMFTAPVRTPVFARTDDVTNLFWLGQTRYDGTLAVEPCPDPPPPQSLLYWDGVVAPPGPPATRFARLARLTPYPDVYVQWETFLSAFDPCEVPTPSAFAGMTWTRKPEGWRPEDPAAAPSVSCAALDLAQQLWRAHRAGDSLPDAVDTLPQDGLFAVDPDGRVPSLAGQAALCLALHEAGRTAAAEAGVVALRDQLSLWLGPEWTLRRGPHPARDPAADARAAAPWLFGLYLWRKDGWFARAAWRLAGSSEPAQWIDALEEGNRFNVYPIPPPGGIARNVAHRPWWRPRLTWLFRGLCYLSVPLLRWRARSPHRTLWGVGAVLTIRQNALADELLGFESNTLVARQNRHGIPYDYNMDEDHWKGRLLRERGWRTLLWALWRFDIFHYFLDRGIMLGRPVGTLNAEELRLLNAAGKRLFFYTYGADVRTRDETLALGPLNCCTYCPAVGEFCVCDSTRGHANVALAAQYADAVVALGDMALYVPNPRTDIWFWPVDTERVPFVGAPQRAPQDEVVIVHAPNHRFFKGTDYLLDTVARLRNRGIRVRVDLVEGLSNEAALQRYAAADIVADQFLIGGVGYFALEGMAMGKPVLCYVRREDWLIAPEECPVVRTQIATLESDLVALLTDADRRAELGRQGRRYVEKYLTVKAVAARLATMYQDHGIPVPRPPAS